MLQRLCEEYGSKNEVQFAFCVSLVAMRETVPVQEEKDKGDFVEKMQCLLSSAFCQKKCVRVASLCCEIGIMQERVRWK
jgi:hypothetical protein